MKISYINKLRSTCKNISDIIKDVTKSDIDFKDRLTNAKKIRYKGFTHKLKDDNGNSMYFLTKNNIRVYLVERFSYGEKAHYINFHEGDISCTTKRLLGIKVDIKNFKSVRNTLQNHLEKLTQHGQYSQKNNLQNIKTTNRLISLFN